MIAGLDQLWDAVVVGAGPAGGMAALRLAQRGHRILLVEAKRFPRDKVCGGCLNHRAWSVLAANGLAPELVRAGTTELERLQLTCGRRRVEWSMPTMRALSRRALDEIIAAAAVASGATFASETQAKLERAEPAADFIAVQLTHHGRLSTVRAKVVIAADGLTHSSLGKIEQTTSRVAPGSRIGLGATLEHTGGGYPSGRLSMAVGAAGYVGLARVEQGLLNIAAALSPESLKSAATPAEVVEQLLAAAGLEVPSGCREANWVGTPPLTRESRQWAARRLFLVGDAASYVEPFTGEGMSWALAGAVELGPLAERAMTEWSDDLARQWHVTWRRHVRKHQATCRSLAWLLRRPRLAEMTLLGAQYAPWVAGWVMHRVSGTRAAANFLGSEV